MVTVALWVRLEAKPGREADLEAFLHAGATGRSAHLMGRIAAALGEHASRLLAAPPAIERLDVLAAKLPN